MLIAVPGAGGQGRRWPPGPLGSGYCIPAALHKGNGVMTMTPRCPRLPPALPISGTTRPSLRFGERREWKSSCGAAISNTAVLPFRLQHSQCPLTPRPEGVTAAPGTALPHRRDTPRSLSPRDLPGPGGRRTRRRWRCFPCTPRRCPAAERTPTPAARCSPCAARGMTSRFRHHREPLSCRKRERRWTDTSPAHGEENKGVHVEHGQCHPGSRKPSRLPQCPRG